MCRSAGHRKQTKPSRAVVLIEHNLDVVKIAGRVIDLGPEGGRRRRNRRLGPPDDIVKAQRSYTGQFLAPVLRKADGKPRGERGGGVRRDERRIERDGGITTATPPDALNEQGKLLASSKNKPAFSDPLLTKAHFAISNQFRPTQNIVIYERPTSSGRDFRFSSLEGFLTCWLPDAACRPRQTRSRNP
jgi:hypothetical protein